MSEEARKKLSNYLENYGAYDLADEFNTQVYMVNTQEFNDLVLLYYFIQKDEIEKLQQENQKKLYTSNGNKFTKYELLDDYESILQENKKLKEKHYLIQGGRGNCKTLVLMLQKEKDKYKSVLDEIREYIKELDDNTDDTTCYDIDRNVRDDLLQILDKVGKE